MGELDAAARLTTSLDEVARALAAPDADALLTAEARLASVLAELSALAPRTPVDRAALADEVLRARTTLARCRILGAALADASRLALAAQGRSADYGRPGGPSAAQFIDSRGHRLRTRL